ncbi:MAG: TolC family protein [Arcobacter sp.]|uniref:RND family efflux system, outer membrane channel protein, TolC family n=1 Tax=Arcobacter defluvii TaxID=873191 RepID=A0AAE7BC84_9BACT|nr:TolC family protein [Arcobacter defluvii]QKF76468.1 RND family efflux system, outer membrane channel protein, TolC family [Arcobacter defluvii]
MHLIKSSKVKLLFCSLISLSLFASDDTKDAFDTKIISEKRLKNIELSKEQIKEDSSKLRKDWINPITYQYTKNLGEDEKTERSLISINQPIFQSGGIYKAIKYADSTYDYAALELDQQQKDLVKQALQYLYNIEKTNLNIQKAKYTLENAKIDVNRKKEQVLNGFLDTSYLDDALLTLNSSKHNLVDLKYQKQDLINSFNNISSQDYTKFELPIFKIFSQKEFLENNIELKKAQADIEKKGNYSYMTMAKYLPSVNAYYTYSKYHDTDNSIKYTKENDQTFGLTLNIPFDSRTFNDIQSTKIDYLKSKLNLENSEDDEKTFFKTKLEKISMLDERLQITREDLEVYDSILKIINEEKQAQIKTQSDVDTLQNSQKIKSLDLKIFEVEKQLELLELYAKLH